MKPLVLIVEDEAPLVTLLRYNLESEGFAVGAAADGEEALLRIAERKPDAVLLDWMLPLVSGLEVCRRIRRGTGDPLAADHHADRARRGEPTASAGSTAAPTTMSSSRSARASWSRGCAR